MCRAIVSGDVAADTAASPLSLVIFSVDGQRYALHLHAVERVVHMVAVTPLPAAPDVVRGVINLAGRVLPVIDLRRRFGLPERDFILSDQLIMAAAGERTVALWVDTATGVVEQPGQEVVPADAIVPGLEQVEGVVKLPDGLVLIHDLKRCLSLEEEEKLHQALATSVGEEP